MNKSKSFDPLWVPIISQYQNTKNLELDEKLIQKHINWLDPHVKQFLVCGTTGDGWNLTCLLYTSPSPRDGLLSRMPSSA